MTQRWQLAGPDPALRKYPDSNEVLVFDALWSETHLVDGTAGRILDLLTQRSACSEPEISGLLEFDGAQRDIVLHYLGELEKLNLVVEVPATPS